MRDFHIPLLPGGLYHILNRGNGDERLFRTEENYYFFLRKYQQYISPACETLAWSLLPNHYHFLIRVKEATSLKAIYKSQKETDIDEDKLPAFIMKQFSNWQNSYAKAYNKVYGRKGSLFMDYMRRVAVDKEQQLGTTVFYIHRNPVHHKYCSHIAKWPFSSYKEYERNHFP